MTNETELMPDVIYATPYGTDKGHGEWDDMKWVKCPFVKDDKKPAMETKYIRADLAIPEGHALVPLEPTEEMRDAGIARQGDHYYSIYKDMIAVAQKGGV